MTNRSASLIATVCFMGWAVLTFQGYLGEFDQWGLSAFRTEHGEPIGTALTSSLIMLVTHMGDTVTLIVLSLGALAWLYLTSNQDKIVAGLVSIVGLFLLNPLLKLVFARARPDVFEHIVNVSSNSFPSGHALRAAGIYFLIYYLLVNRIPVNMSRVLFWLCIVIAVSTGVSRVYLGVHWPTDIVASWLVAAAWVLGWREALSVEKPSYERA
ncbi:phosphatase PAP2 family protein [Kordiimonas sp.]|uniref:phosphatase PAP2 family protein n=1 Tax=Kordiimonas sp. TaxID=1970157 RepID=UPI003A938101